MEYVKEEGLKENWMLPYIAGLFDGEGCVSIAMRRFKKKKGIGIRYILYARITNTNRKALEYVKKYLKLGNIQMTRPSTTKHKACFALEVCSRQARILLESILPFLKIKRKQALLGIKFQGLLHFNEIRERDSLGRIKIAGYSSFEKRKQKELRKQILFLNR